MRTIKFRGRDNQGEWHYGYLVIRLGITYIFEEIWEYYRDSYVKTNKFKEIEVSADTVGQFVELYDKNGKEIYEGDIIRYTDIEEFCVNPDCDLYLQFSQTYACVEEDVVIFKNGMFTVANDYYIRPLCYYGIEDLEDLRNCLGVKDGENEDINGTIIDDSLLGLKVIGNTHDNPELLKGE